MITWGKARSRFHGFLNSSETRFLGCVCGILGLGVYFRHSHRAPVRQSVVKQILNELGVWSTYSNAFIAL